MRDPVEVNLIRLLKTLRVSHPALFERPKCPLRATPYKVFVHDAWESTCGCPPDKVAPKWNC